MMKKLVLLQMILGLSGDVPLTMISSFDSPDSVRLHVLVQNKMNWIQAQSYCRQTYTDLSTYCSDAEKQVLEKVVPNDCHAWIGLYLNSSNQYVWSDGLPCQATPLESGQCGLINADGLSGNDCGSTYYSVCYESLQKVTWEEALEFCRNNSADLASSESLSQVLDQVAGAEYVWVGLRFFAGQWFWLNTETEESLLDCPVTPYLCGAYNVNLNQLENRDCEEENIFFCG